MWTFLIGIIFVVLGPSFWELLLSNTKHKEHLYFYQIIKFLAGISYGFLVNYVGLIDHTFNAFCSNVLLALGLVILIDSFMVVDESELAPIGFIAGIASIVISLLLIFVYPVTVTQDLSIMTNAETSTNSMEETSIDHIIVVSQEYAKYKGQQLLSKVPNYSYYQVGAYHEQKIGNELFWVAPLEYTGFWVSRNADCIPAYIKVSAENITKPAELVSNLKMKYVPSAFFGDNLKRMVREKYPNIIIMDASFEPDDSGKPFYVVSYGHYAKFRSGDVIDGAILFDPQTGEMTEYSKDKVPVWVDQIIPADVAGSYNEYFGKYQDGIWAYWFNPKNVHVPTQWGTGEEVIGVYDKNGDMSWFTDHTTDSKSNSMVGYTLMDGRTGKLTYYTGANGFLNGQAACGVVNKTFTKDVWKASTPILYNIYGEDTWVVTVVDSDGKFRKLAVVNARTGNIASGDTKEQAFESYKAVLANQKVDSNKNPNNNNALVNIQGEVFRVSHMSTANGEEFKIILKDNLTKIYNANSTLLPYVCFVQPGDKVNMKCVDTKEVISNVQEFHDITLGN